jgi:hypothetical protein
MAANFPYFKFTATEWLTGDIIYEDYELQGIFINVCAIYWNRDGKITFDEMKKRIKSERLAELSGGFFSLSDGFISIAFLDEQLIAAKHISKTNSKNGKKGGRPKAKLPLEEKPNALIPFTETKPKKSNKEEEEEKEEEKNKNKNKETAFLSDVLNSEYIAVLELWLQHKKERKEHYKPTGLKTLAEKIKKDYKTVQEFESAVKHSIANNWAGMYAPKTQINQTANTAAPNKMVY